MAYACPVCAEPQVDGEHLANHVAFTAITGDADHEDWLDATVPQWGELGQAELADHVAEHAEETEFPIDVDGSDVDGDHELPHSGAEGHPNQSRPGRGPGNLAEDTRDVLAEARDLTREMQASDEETGDADVAERSDSESQ